MFIKVLEKLKNKNQKTLNMTENNFWYKKIERTIKRAYT